MTKGKLKTIDIRFFLVPFSIFFTLFALNSYIIMGNSIKDMHIFIEKQSIEITEIYAKRINDFNCARETIINLINEKLTLVAKAIIQLENSSHIKSDIEALDKFRRRSYVDEIIIYNNDGQIINSTTREIIGKNINKSCTAYNFIKSKKDISIGNIEENTETGISYKYIYIKGEDNSTTQIGILAEKITEFLYRFELEQLFNESMVNAHIENIFFINIDHKLVVSGKEGYGNITSDNEDTQEHFFIETAKLGKKVINGKNTFHVCVPVFHDKEKIGTLTIVWLPTIINKVIKKTILNYMFNFLLTSILFGCALYYAYHKNKSNIEIAFYDKLTQLPNNEYFKEYLEQQLKDCKNNRVAVMLLNCENFNLINLTYGLRYGDKVIRQIAEAISRSISAESMLFRLEADKFVIVINGYHTSEELNNLSRKLINKFRAPDFDMQKHKYLNLKIAIYETCESNITIEQLLHDLSHGIALLKGNPNKDFLVYDQKMKNVLKREEIIEKTLLSIINGELENNLYMVYQPLLDIKSNKILSFEALARLTIPGIGEVSPLEFINLAENRNLIFPLGNTILKKALDFLQLLKELGHRDIRVSINISILQLLRDEFVDSVKEIINESRIGWDKLFFEITESTLVANFMLVNKKLAELKTMGSLVALDDFGTGYSSFSRLRNLNIDTIKIDRSFIEKIGHPSENAMIAEDIIYMSHRLGLKVVAEGVENKKQMDYLKKHGCDIVQGFYISKPLVKSGAVDFLKKHNK